MTLRIPLFVRALAAVAAFALVAASARSPGGRSATPMDGTPLAGVLDGRTFTGTLTLRDDAKTTSPETVAFENGMARSTTCDAAGFAAARYTTVKSEDGSLTVQATMRNGKGDEYRLLATVREDKIDGTLSSVKADGSKTVQMDLRAAEKAQ